MGGLSRKSAYIKSIKSKNLNPIIVDAGDALFTRTQFPLLQVPSQQTKAKYFLDGMGKIGCDALNIGEYDLSGGYEFLKSLQNDSKIPFISANLFENATGKLAFKPYVKIKRDNVKIGIIGVTENLPQAVAELYKEDYLVSGKKYIDKLRNSVDVLIVLVNSNIANKNTITESFKDADYIYLSKTVMNTRANTPHVEGGPIFYTFGINGKHLVEVKTTLVDDTKPIVDVSSDRYRADSIKLQIKRLTQTNGTQTLEEKYADNPRVIDQIEKLKKQVKESEENLTKAVNVSEIKIVAMSKNMEFDNDMQLFVDNALKESKN